ncbi:MAG: hypothetical protein FWF04_05650 [Clostridiales bacterium]|nr:hypothetical protein [Clostridiales bacterium]
MEFESSLSCEQVKSRLLTVTIPLTFSNISLYSEGNFLAKWNKNDTFYLIKTGGSGIINPMMAMNPIPPFVGEVISKDTGSIIKGKFSLAKSTKIVVSCFLGFIWLLLLFASFLNTNHEVGVKLLVFMGGAVFSALFYAMFSYVPNFAYRKNHQAVIGFINDNLLM